jgi:hypothetical protein
MFIGFLRCNHCDYKSEEFLCMWHHWRNGYQVAVQNQETLAIRLIHVPDDDIFYQRSDKTEEEWQRVIDGHVASVLAQNMSETEKEIPILALLQEKPVRVLCPSCRESLNWLTIGIT